MQFLIEMFTLGFITSRVCRGVLNIEPLWGVNYTEMCVRLAVLNTLES